jgi:hypothetical protein
MIIVKATKESEGGVMPSEKLLAEMGKFNEDLAKCRRAVSRRWPAPQLKRRARQILRE